MALTTFFKERVLLPKTTEPLFPFADTVHREPQYEKEMFIPHTKNKHCITPASQTELSKTQQQEEKRNSGLKR